MKFKAKIRLSPDGIDVYYPTGNIQGITTQVMNGNICRLKHPLFSEETTFVQCTLIEQSDNEIAVMAASATGICDMYCYDGNSQLKNNYYFQITIEIG